MQPFKCIGVISCPVIGYDRWDSVEYREMVKSISLPAKAFFCIRLDSIALEDLGDPEHFDGIIEDISAQVNIVESETPVLVDIGDVTQIPMQEVVEYIESAYAHMMGMGFKYIIMAGSSIPDSIEKAVKK